MQAFTDNPIDTEANDKFDFKIYVDILRDTLWQTGPLPFCVGIFGPWGCGKTSFMKLLQQALKDQARQEADLIKSQTTWYRNLDKQIRQAAERATARFRKSVAQIEQEAEHVKVETIWFNPWKYDQKEDLWHALIQTVLAELEKRVITPEMKDKAKQLARAATWLAVKSLITGLSAGIVSGSDLDKLGDIVGNKDNVYYQNINQFEDGFATLVESYVGKKGKLVIFIDDLDRCLPENAITVLESLKLFMGHAQCIFILGMDHYIVGEGISVRYKKTIRMTGRDYLDKIIQIPFYLPPVPYEKLRLWLEQSESQVIFMPEIWEIIRLSMGGNPRKIKRFVTSFLLSQEILKHSNPLQAFYGSTDLLPALSPKMQDIYLAKLLVFQMMFLDFYQYLQLRPDAWESLESIAGYPRGKREAELVSDETTLKDFASNESLTNFMSRTIGNWNQNRLVYPESPKAAIVSRLLQFINLVSDSGPPDKERSSR